MKVNTKIDVRQILANFKQLQNGLKNKAMRIALNKASSPVKADIVSGAPSETGALKKSQRIKLANYKNKDVWIAIIGPKRDFKKTKKGKTREPSKYAGLVERGTKYFPGDHYLASAFKSAKGTFLDRVCASLREQIVTMLPK